MTQIAGAVGVGAVGLGLLMIIGIFLRRVALTRRARVDAHIAAGLREIALKITVGTDVIVPNLTAREAAVFSEQLGELAMAVRGDGRGRIADAAEQLGLVEIELRKLRRSWRAWRRASAARVLGTLGSPRAEEALIAALDDRDRDVRATAARSLGHLGIVDAAGAVIRALGAHQLPRAVVVEAALLLGPGAVPSLREQVQMSDIVPAPVTALRGGAARARATCIELIGHLGDASDGKSIIGNLHDPDPDIRAATARALGRLGSRRSLDMLMATLEDEVDFVRGAAAEALGRINAAPAFDALMEIANSDRSWWTSAWAARSAARIDPARVRAAAAEPGASQHIIEAADVLTL